MDTVSNIHCTLDTDLRTPWWRIAWPRRTWSSSLPWRIPATVRWGRVASVVTSVA